MEGTAGGLLCGTRPVPGGTVAGSGSCCCFGLIRVGPLVYLLGAAVGPGCNVLGTATGPGFNVLGTAARPDFSAWGTAAGIVLDTAVVGG